MIYVTGDLHGDLSRLRSKAARRLKKGDYLIICGDFGFVWDDSPKEKRVLKWLGKRPYYVLFVEGTHDNLDLLYSYPVTPWNGGRVHQISGKVLHLIRGSVFMIEGTKVFAFGGGASNDADIRIKDNCWWPRELPNQAELDFARESLERHNNRVDYIVTHQCCRKVKRLLNTDESDFNVLDIFLDEIRDNSTYKRWFFGSHHVNKIIPPSEVALFGAIVPVTSNKW